MTSSQIENIIAAQQRKCEKYKKRSRLHRQFTHLKNALIKREINE